MFGFRGNSALFCNPAHKRIDHLRFGIHQRISGRRFTRLFTGKYSVRKAELYRLICVHPCFCVHEVRDFRTAHSRLDFISVHNAFLDLGQHFDCFLHFRCISHCHRHGIVYHQHRNRGHKHLVSRHCNNRSGACGYAVYFHRDVSLVVHQHIVDLRCRNAVPAGRVYPDGNISAAGQQFFLEKLRRDVIVKPAFICDSAVEEQRSLRVLLLRFFVLYHLVRPLPEFLHRIFPPFRHQ